jgi:hypothetical protein
MRRNEIDPNAEQEARATSVARPSLGLTRGRLAAIVAALVCLWLVGVFAKQVGDAAAASEKTDAMRARNAAVVRQIQGLQAELELIQRPGFTDSTARGFLLGLPGEIPFVVDSGTTPVAADAPGSVGITADASKVPTSPLDAWLRALFGSE